MKYFILKTIAFLSIVSAIFLYILSTADGHDDAFYKRFTTPKQDNLILGTSRSAQGLQPSVFQKTLNKEFLNYSFTLFDSPYGHVYLNSIKKKLNTEVKNGVFIVSVDPWSISSNTKNPNDTINFYENESFMSNTTFVNMSPNFEYLIENLKGKYYKVLTKDRKVFLHDDGWLELTVPMDSASGISRFNERIKDYKTNKLLNFHFSSARLNYLKRTIEYLKLHGKVYIVRLPVHPEFFEVDSELIHEFNDVILPITQLADGYLDMSKENNLYQYIDGVHPYKESSKLMSIKIAEWIKNGPDAQHAPVMVGIEE
jgi:hypothetical protein